MKIPITQSREWQTLQGDLGEKSFLKEEQGYSYLAILKHTPAGNYLYCPYGPCYDDQAGFEQAITSLCSLAAQQHAIFIRIEPQDPKFPDYAPQNARKSRDLNPKETWLLDLSGTDDDLKQKLPSRLLRYHKAAERKGITITKSHDPADIHYLLDLQKALAKEKGISTFSEHYLATELKQSFATLYLAEQKITSPSSPQEGDGSEGELTELQSRLEKDCDRQDPPREASGIVEKKVLAAGLVFDDVTTRYNLQGAQSDDGRRLHATGILTIQLILDAKDKGLKTFDFWGIAPEGAPDTHPWAGFTNFKKTFAGYEQDYAGTYDLVLSPTKYKIYQASRRLGRLLH